MKRIIISFMFVFVTQAVWADYITTNIINACDNEAIFRAVFTKKQVSCTNGYFLPANTETCEACPLGYSCTGGTYVFNETLVQGAEYLTPVTSDINKICDVDTVWRAVFAPKNITCSSGQYLPAGIDACAQCPADSYCVGGTYTFNETTNQGIEPCATGYSSTAGSSSCTANTISITWADASAEDIAANDAGSVTYGGDIRTPKKAVHKPGKIFTGWTFNTPSGN